MRGWSPEIVAGWIRRQGDRSVVSHETIYKWIYRDAPHLIQYLTRSHKKRFPRHHSRKHRRVHIPDRVSIQERPAIIESRKQPGHWESDLLVGKGAMAVQVVAERMSRVTLLAKLPDKTAGESSRALIGLLSCLPATVRQSVTYDNGSENVQHREVNRALGMQSYFCQPYHSWEKGMVENTNGLIRRFFPKRTDLSTITARQLKMVQDWLNHRPRKCLGFQTPAEVLKSWGVALAP
jgi:IS30 family transposase